MTTADTRGYPPDWDSRRKRVYRRDGYQCQNCGADGGSNGDTELHAHHIVPKSEGGTHRLSNLTTLCRSCHSDVHGYPVGGQPSVSDNTEGIETTVTEGAVGESQSTDSSRSIFDFTTTEWKVFVPFYLIACGLIFLNIEPWIGAGLFVGTFAVQDLRRYYRDDY